MIEEERAEEATSSDMAEAIESIKSSSPDLAQALGATGMTADKLADAHHRATSESQGQPSEQG
jgi:hypothetical protein